MNILKKYPELTGSPILQNEGALTTYITSRAKGEPHRFAEMCALQCPPGTKNTDKAFCEGARREMEGMDPKNREHILNIAKKAGIKTQGKFFKSMSAGGDGFGGYDDPGSWVTCAEDVLTVAKERNLGVSGVVNHKAVDMPAPVKKIKLGEDIVQRHVAKIMATEPRTAERVKKNPKVLAEVRERVIAKHSRKK